jgi:hypothetical protein
MVRDQFLRAVVVFGAALVIITELLSVLQLIRRGPLLLFWSAVFAAALVCMFKRPPRLTPGRDPVAWILGAGVVIVLALTAVTAAFSPPNSADAMAYHMPRVVYWAEQASVRFFPTPYLNQIMLPPLAEYMMLHTYVLSTGDRLINLVQWFGSLGSTVGVSLIARLFGAPPRSQALAALFCATIPAGVLAASGAKNDLWLSMWLVAAVYFALVFAETMELIDAVFLGTALGLALLTKATAYLFIPWPLAAIFFTRSGKSWRRIASGAAAAAVIAAAINTPQFIRNYDLSGSILGFDSAQGDGFFRWRNESFGWKMTASNALRNFSEQLGARGEEWNQGIYRLVIAAHQRIGMDPSDPRTTWPWTSFAPPKNANHEANVPNRWQLTILSAAFVALAAQSFRRREAGRLFVYAVSLLCGFIAFCAYLKWQLFMGRLLLPLFVLASPMVTAIGGKRWPIQLVLGLFLLNNARRPLIENWTRPLKGPNSVFHTPRDSQYFSDMNQWNNQASYWKAVDLITASNCRTVGIDIADFQLEYPLQALLRERNPSIRFLHTGVRDASSKYLQPAGSPPCAVVCLDCAGDSARLQIYTSFPRSVLIGKFVVFKQ